ncbi:hypothetical protein [Pampinifervens florentissimum]|uniref:hypothetical protein n=1 Tax=Pampinifervens florentissimum TaxID=1632019 RepID=UPI0013B4791E|nr:hypothetical protein [Hydrogenobacter sp. T-8]QID33094.1 hypothetical protein G3M65_04640 [Hydrogenobacter sp. T-8]
MKKIIGQSKKKNLFWGIPQKFSVKLLRKRAIINLMDRLDRIKELVEKRTKEEEIVYKLASLEEKEREEILAQVEREDPKLADELRKKIKEVEVYGFINLNWVKERYVEGQIFGIIVLLTLLMLVIIGSLLYFTSIIDDVQLFFFIFPAFLLSILIATPIYLLLPRQLKNKIAIYIKRYSFFSPPS